MKKQTTDNVVGTVIITLLLLPQIWHTHRVFEVNNTFVEPSWISWAYAVGIDTAILYLARKGWLKTAFGYLFVTLAHNIVYYITPKSIWSVGLICVSLSATIFALTHLFIKRQKKKHDDSGALLDIPESVWYIHQAMEAGVHFEPQPFSCPECLETFSSKKQLNGHVSSHKKQDQWKPKQYGEWELKNHKRSLKAL
jgi:hypothetical protein